MTCRFPSPLAGDERSEADESKHLHRTGEEGASRSLAVFLDTALSHEGARESWARTVLVVGDNA
jgi:hypothetical protein